MTITFYKTSDDPRKLNKTMINIGANDAAVTAPVNNTADTINLLSPDFIVASNNLYFTATHIFCADMGNRYYFISNIELLTGGKMSISCNIDVLKTYASNIINCSGVVLRTQQPRSKLMYDNKLPLISKMDVHSWLFPDTPFSAADGWNYLLTVVGSSSV